MRRPKKLEQPADAKPAAASPPRLAEGNFRTTTVRAVTAASPSGRGPVVTALPEQKPLAPSKVYDCPEVNDYSGQFSGVGNTSRPQNG